MPQQVIKLLALRALANGNSIQQVCSGLSDDVVNEVLAEIAAIRNSIKVRL